MSRRVSTADVRPVTEMIPELRGLMLAKLPGDSDVRAAWAALCEAVNLYDDALSMLLDIAPDAKGLDRMRRFQYEGQRYAAAKVIRSMADAYGVSSFREGVEGV